MPNFSGLYLDLFFPFAVRLTFPRIDCDQNKS